MKRSIKRQLIAMFVGLLVFAIGALAVINMWFLEPYYIQNKQKSFLNMYDALMISVEDGSVTEDDTLEELRHMAERSNLSFLVMDADQSVTVTNVHDMDLLERELTGYMLSQMQDHKTVLKSTDSYELVESKDPVTNNEYIEMWGTFDDGYRFLIRSPLESIRDSTIISNQFMIYIGVAVILLAVVIAMYLAKRLTDPIKELAELSDQMADLNFEAKYTSGGSNEIGELGENFNRMSEKLESTISELKSANNALQKDIEQKEKLEQMRNDFMGNVSHELKTPIALIQGYAEGLRDGITDDPENMQFYCDVIIDEAGKMNQMVKNLLTLNQMEFGDEELEYTRFDIVPMIEGVIASMDIMSLQGDTKVIFKPEGPVYVWADAYNIEHVLRNYLSNAFHHVKGDNVIEVKVLADDEKARISVFNTGDPIAEEDISHIWEKFYKADKAHTRSYGGNGIGLSIVKAIMESMRQSYGVKNYDNGVEFWFELDVK